MYYLIEYTGTHDSVIGFSKNLTNLLIRERQLNQLVIKYNDAHSNQTLLSYYIGTYDVICNLKEYGLLQNNFNLTIPLIENVQLASSHS